MAIVPLLLLIVALAIVSRLGGPPPAASGSRSVRRVLLGLALLLAAIEPPVGFAGMLILVGWGLRRGVLVALTDSSGSKRSGRYGTAGLIAALSLGAGVCYVGLAWRHAEETLSPSRQRRTLGSMRDVGTAISRWSADQGALGQPPYERLAAISFGAGASPPEITASRLREMLVPHYLLEVPEQDAWGTRLDYRFDPGDGRFRVRSAGGDRRFEADVYLVGAFDARETKRDLVYADGRFVAWPMDPAP